MFTSVIGSLLITYFVSRLMRRIGWPLPGVWAVVAPHVASFAVIALGIFAMRYPINSFAFAQLNIYAGTQVLWLIVDFFRAKAHDQSSSRA